MENGTLESTRVSEVLRINKKARKGLQRSSFFESLQTFQARN